MNFTRHPERAMPITKNQEDTKTAVVDLSKQLFSSLRGRIMKNVLLKFYNFFLVPMYVKKRREREREEMREREGGDEGNKIREATTL